jgi:glutathione S-transferase
MSIAPRRLFDLAGADPNRRFSPYCWRVRMALAHKGLEVETVPWRFTDKAAIAFSGQGRVPVLVDGDNAVFDSWSIAQYLEMTYPEAPPLFGNAMPATRFINAWADRTMLPAVASLILLDVFNELHEQDRDYFRSSRERAFGRTLEAVTEGREQRVIGFRQLIEPIRTVLKSQPFLAGENPGYADYIPFGVLQWARTISPFRLLVEEDPVFAWREKLLDLYGGLARHVPAY